MHTPPFLSIVLGLPIAGALIILMSRGKNERSAGNAHSVALWTSVFTFVASLLLLWGFDPDTSGYQFVESSPWLGKFATYGLGVDGISLPFILLTTAITPLAIAASRKSIEFRTNAFLIAFLILEALLVGAFSATDTVLFYIFFEGSLIPMFFIIGVWGGQRRVYATFKFFLYTLAGSVLMLLAIMAMFWQAGSTDLTVLSRYTFSPDFQFWAWLAFFASLAVKLPMWPVHTWLPDAHVEAPTSGSVMLAAILLKLGGYGFLRFSLPMFPLASEWFAPFVISISLIAIVYTSLVALVQEDMKKLIAYSSVAHMGFVTIGMFSFTQEGLQGAMFQMISHGFISGGLFLCAGCLYERTHSRNIKDYGGVVRVMPVFAMMFMFFTLANAALPGTSGFVGEFLALAGAFQLSVWVAAIAATGMVLSAAYALWLYRRVMFEGFLKESLSGLKDLSPRERAILIPLIFATLLFGLYPAPILDGTIATLNARVFCYLPVDLTNQECPARALSQDTLNNVSQASEYP